MEFGFFLLSPYNNALTLGRVQEEGERMQDRQSSQVAAKTCPCSWSPRGV